MRLSRGRTLNDAEGRRLNDLLYGLLISAGYSPADSHFVLSMKRVPRHRRRRQREVMTHAPDILAAIRSTFAGEMPHAG
jgi:hypothetical protein